MSYYIYFFIIYFSNYFSHFFSKLMKNEIKTYLEIITEEQEKTRRILTKFCRNIVVDNYFGSKLNKKNTKEGIKVWKSSLRNLSHMKEACFII